MTATVPTGVTRDCPPGAAPFTAVESLQVTPGDGRAEVIAAVPVRPDDPNLCGHFPGLKIFPGVFVIEALEQAVDGALRAPGGPRLRLSAIDSVRFLAPLFPPDLLTLDLNATAEGAGRWSVTASGRRSDGTVAVKMRARFDGVLTASPIRPGPVTAGRALDHRTVRSLLPQRYPLLLVDRVLAIDDRTTAEAVKAVTGTEPCYRQLTDSAPASDYAYPASLLVESFGQTAALLWLAGADDPVRDDQVLMFVGARNLTFHGAAYPGEFLRHVVRLERAVADTVFATGETFAGDRCIARMESLMAARRPRAALAVPATADRDSLVHLPLERPTRHDADRPSDG